jgi:membrane associated rhomboid family serine protease
VVAALTHLLTQQQSTVPTVGASGAIAGVLCAYLLFSDGAAGGDVSGAISAVFL